MTEWSPFIHSVFGEISKKIRKTEEAREEKKPWVFSVSGLKLLVREIGKNNYEEILELDPNTGYVISKVIDSQTGKTMPMEAVISKYLSDNNKTRANISFYAKISVIQEVFESAYLDYAHFR